jgi:DNA invertase Pin-like site-specific DNA recombinase
MCSSSPACPAPCGRSSTCSRSPTSCAPAAAPGWSSSGSTSIRPRRPGRLVFHILGAIDEFQRELIIEGTGEGLDAARARGRTGGRKPKLNARQAATVRRMYQAVGPDGKRQHTVAEIAEAVGVHRTTVYDYLNKDG